MFLKRLMVEEEGQGLVEYTLILALVVIGIWAAVALFDIPGKVTAIWTNVAGQLDSAPGVGGGGAG